VTGLFATAAGAVVPTLLLRVRRGAAGFLLGGSSEVFLHMIDVFHRRRARDHETPLQSIEQCLVAWRTGGDSIDMARFSNDMFLTDLPLIPEEPKA